MKAFISLAIIGLTLSTQTQAQSQNLEFEGAAKAAKPFRTFELTEADGTPVPVSREAILSQTSESKARILEAASVAKERLVGQGFENLKAITESALAPIRTTAGQYLNEFNDAEQKLTALGYSLRDGVDIVAAESQKFNRETLGQYVEEAAEVYAQEGVAELQRRKDELEKRIAELEAAAKGGQTPSTTKESVYLQGTKDECGERNPNANSVSQQDANCFLSEIEQKDTPFVTIEPETCKADTPLGKAFLVNESWSDGGGDKNFGWNATAKFVLGTDASGLKLDSEATANAVVFNQSKEVLKAKVNFISGRTTPATSHRSLTLFGEKISEMDETYAVNLVNSKDEKGHERHIQTKDQPLLSQTFMVGFVPVLVAVDSRVSMGPQYSLDLVGVKLTGRAEWVSKVTVIASAGVGADLKVFVVLAGIKGSIDLINTTIGVYPSAELYLDEKNHPVIGARLSSMAKLVTLSGQLDIGVWAKTTFAVPQPKKSWPFFENKPLEYEWKQTLGRYPGYEFPTATLFDKKVGYDICSGRKQTEVLIANQPRQRDERETFEVRENARVTQLEEKFKLLVDEKLFDERAEKYEKAANKIVTDIDALTANIDELAQRVLSKAI